jgi:hypothetical protein
MKKTYKRIILIFATTALLIGSCSEDFLDHTPPSVFTTLNYYKNVDELETGLVACFSYLRAGIDADHWMIGDLNSDDADCGSNPGDQPELYDISYSRQKPSGTWIWYFWCDFYAVIARCNEVIDRSTGTQGDPAAIERIVDQAKYLRALCYYHLVTTYGDVPLVNRFLNPEELKLKRAPTSEIWTQIESDLKDATNLPASSEWNESGRVSSGAAYSLLGKVYLTQKKYAQANSAFNKVVSSNEYQLVSDFGLIFRHEGENCAESVFEIQHKVNIPDGNLGTSNSSWRMPRDYEANGWGFDTPTGDLFNEYESGDPRIIYTFIFPGDQFPAQEEGKTFTVECFESPTGYNARKAWVPWSERKDLGYWEIDYNYRYMRYAEVLLLYGESLNETNKPDSALILLNMVRARARSTPPTDPQRVTCAHDLSHTGDLLPDVTTYDQFDLRQAIWHEQRVELAIEGHRRNMLLRMGEFKERMEAAKAYAGVSVEAHELLFPIPQMEIEVTNGMITQNPGY